MTRFERSLESYLNRTDAARQPNWRLEPLDKSILFCLWSDADEELKRNCATAMHVVAHELVDTLEMELSDAAEKCSSPMERQLFLALFIVGRHLDKLASRIDVLGRYTIVDVKNSRYDRPHLSIIPQYEIADYTVDFIVEYAQEYLPRNSNPDPNPRCAQANLLIECDGHNYHDRTKEQASNDRARDRQLQKMGYEVFRYTGSDIYNDPFKCAVDAVDLPVRKVHALRKQFDEKYPIVMDDLLD